MKRWMIVVLAAVLALPVLLPEPVQAQDTIGDGTPALCTEAQLDSVLAGGGLIDFNCGPSPVTITLTRTKVIATDTRIDGGGLITLRADDVRAFYVEDGVNFALDNLTVTRGLATSGSAIFNDGGAIRITNTTFYYNVARSMRGVSDTNAGRGGAIFNRGGDVIVDGSRFLFNQAWDYGGGAIFNDGGLLVVRRSLFALNYAPGLAFTAGGGAIFNQSEGIANVTGSAFVFNVAYNGGAIYNNENASLAVAGGSSFIVNLAPWSRGGALYSVGTLDVLGSSFTMNYARFDGGAIAAAARLGATDLVLNVNGSTFVRNRSARGKGGAIRVENGRVFVGASTFERNRARSGGALALIETVTAVQYSRVETNTADELGGGVFVSGDQPGYPLWEAGSYSGQLTLTWVTLAGNRARSGGGLGVDNAYVLVDRSLFARNDALNKGGGIFNGGDDSIGSIISRGWIDAINTTFSFNHAVYGGAIALGGDSDLYPRRSLLVFVDLEYVTFYGNGADDDGESLYGPDFRGHWVIFGDTLNGRDNCSEPIFDVEEYYGIEFPRESCGGYRRVDPLLGPLADNGGLTWTYALLSGSPALDAVPPDLSDLCAAGYRDQRDFPRPGVLSGVAGTWCDYGAYEGGEPLNTVTEPLTQATPEPTVVILTLTPVPTATPVPQPQCGNFSIAAPRDGFPYGQAMLYWNPSPSATGYRVLFFNEKSELVASYEVAAPATNLVVDMTNNGVGPGLQFTWRLEALFDGQPFCQDQVTLYRETPPPFEPPPAQPDQPPPPTGPVCGDNICDDATEWNMCPQDCGCNNNNICEPQRGETPQLCPNECTN
jgi:hypothetical protein